MGIGLQIFVWNNECELKVHSNILQYKVHVFNINRFPKSYHQFLYWWRSGLLYSNIQGAHWYKNVYWKTIPIYSISRSNKNTVLSVWYLFLVTGFIKTILGHQEWPCHSLGTPVIEKASGREPIFLTDLMIVLIIIYLPWKTVKC